MTAVPESPARTEIAPHRLGVEEVTDAEGLRVASEWRAWPGGALSSDFFLSWEWISTWLDAFLETPRMQCLLMRDGSRLVGVLPLVSHPLRGPWVAWRLQAPANDETPSTGVSCVCQLEVVVRGLLEHLVETRPRLRLALPRVPIDSPFHRALRSQAAALDLGLIEREARRSLVVNIRGPWEEYLESKSKHTCREWRRKKRRLEDAGHVEVVLVTRPEQVQLGLSVVEEVERRSWKEEGGTSISADPRCERFYSELTRRCAERGWLRLYLLYVHGRPAAHLLGVEYANELLALKTSYDAALANLSPGLTLMLTVLERAFRDGRSALDLLGAASRWKKEIANGQRRHADVLVFSRGLVDCEIRAWVEQHLKPFARAHMPALLALKHEAVEHWRRRR